MLLIAFVPRVHFAGASVETIDFGVTMRSTFTLAGLALIAGSLAQTVHLAGDSTMANSTSPPKSAP